MARRRLHLAAARLPEPVGHRGYDIADFFDDHYGTIEDFRAFVDQAHQRGLRVIADLVMTSPPTTRGSRQPDRPTRPYGDWYVVGDDDARWSEAG